MTISSKQPVLIAGIPRSGTSWIGEILSCAEGVTYAYEPDNEKNRLAAYLLKQGLHRFPYLDERDECDDYFQLWQLAFADYTPGLAARISRRLLMRDEGLLEREIGRKCWLGRSLESARSGNHTESMPAARRLLVSAARGALRSRLKLLPLQRAGQGRVIVKSVHCALALPWICRHFSPRVVVVLRNPLNLISSYLTLGLPDAIRNVNMPGNVDLPQGLTECGGSCRLHSQEQHMAIQIGIFYSFLERQIGRHPDWTVVEHEGLCRDPLAGFRRLFEQTGIEWSDKVESAIERSNASGQGFQTRRVASQELEKWKGRLSDKQVNEIVDVLKPFGLARWEELSTMPHDSFV